MSAYETLKMAIQLKQNISADYKGYPRLMTPHTLGTKNGKEQCLLYQYGGKSSSATSFPENSPANWRCVVVDELENVEIVRTDPHTCDQHTKGQTCVDEVDVEISFNKT
jgi:hypothetical protein